MARRKKAHKIPKVPLDRGPAKKGRPGVRQAEIVGRARNYRRMFWTFRLLKRKNNEENEWVRDKPYEWAVALAAAKTEDDVTRALDSAFSHVQNELKPLILLIFQALREPDFPKRQEKQLDFLADSLSARGQVSPRRSRDICAETRAIERAKSRHRIVRREYYVECSCGYKGPARDNACRKCGAAIELALDDLMERGLV